MASDLTVLITGASGFIGSHLVELLSASGSWSVIAADVTQNDRTASFSGLPNVEVVDLDLRDRAALDALVKRSTHVVHLAALRPAAASARPRDAFEVNVSATYDLIELATEHGVKRIVFGASHSVYGAFREPRTYRYRETDTYGSGLGFYGASKIAVEAYLAAHAQAGGPEYVSLRLGTIYGPRVNRDNSLGGMMMDAIDAARAGGRPEVSWSPDSMHDLVYVDDAARSIERALEIPQTGIAINVTGDPIPTTRLFRTLVELAGGDPDAIDWRPEKSRYQMVSNERLHAVLGPMLQTSFEQGIRNFVDWHDATSNNAG
jgi:nucleoside-diphosphate-sugar epimerase